MRSDNRRYLPQLDVFRAVAAWWVVMYHTVIRFTPAGDLPYMWVGSDNPLVVLFSQGWIAVSVFVMLSGYSLSLGLRRGDIIWTRYLGARWLRVAPLYLVVLLLGTLAATTGPTPGSFFSAASLLPIPGAFSPGPWMATAWSVRIEFVLYLLIPAFVYAARRYRPLPALLMGVVIMAVTVLALARTSTSIDILYWGLPGRLVEFGAGFALGWAGRCVPHRARWAAVTVVVVGFGVLAYIGNRSGGLLDLPGTTRVGIYLAALSLALLLLASVDQQRRPQETRVLRAASAIGSWSYSTYLWHAVVVNLLVAPLLFDRTTPLGFHGALAAGVVVTAAVVLALSWASFNLIEKPFLTLRPKYVREAVVRAPADSQMAPVHTSAGPVTAPVVATRPALWEVSSVVRRTRVPE